MYLSNRSWLSIHQPVRQGGLSVIIWRQKWNITVGFTPLLCLSIPIESSLPLCIPISSPSTFCGSYKELVHPAPLPNTYTLFPGGILNILDLKGTEASHKYGESNSYHSLRKLHTLSDLKLRNTLERELMTLRKDRKGFQDSKWKSLDLIPRLAYWK